MYVNPGAAWFAPVAMPTAVYTMQKNRQLFPNRRLIEIAESLVEDDDEDRRWLGEVEEGSRQTNALVFLVR